MQITSFSLFTQCKLGDNCRRRGELGLKRGLLNDNMPLVLLSEGIQLFTPSTLSHPLLRSCQKERSALPPPSPPTSPLLYSNPENTPLPIGEGQARGPAFQLDVTVRYKHKVLAGSQLNTRDWVCQEGKESSNLCGAELEGCFSKQKNRLHSLSYFFFSWRKQGLYLISTTLTRTGQEPASTTTRYYFYLCFYFLSSFVLKGLTVYFCTETTFFLHLLLVCWPEPASRKK